MDIGDETQSRIDDVLEYASGIAKKLIWKYMKVKWLR
jgi:hypothetical protein